MARGGESVLAGLALGAGLMFFLDPERGRTRRARLRDQLRHAARVGSEAVGATGRDVAHRTAGAAARVRGKLHSEQVDDDVLVERVRSQLGRIVSHPRAITVRAEKGVVTLSGPILVAEVPRLVRTVERIRGVREVISALDEHETGGSIPALQGTGHARSDRKKSMVVMPWSPAARFLAGSTGVTLTSVGAKRGGATGALLVTAGMGLIARAAINPARRGAPAHSEGGVNA